MSSKPLSLYELNNRIRQAVIQGVPERLWVQAEMSEVNENRSGHCYIELIEKEPSKGELIAKTRANIWANTYRLIRPDFESVTGQPFRSGIKVLLLVSVNYHELYGFSLVVHDIDPTYTLGDMARQRKEVMLRLQTEGIAEMNQELVFPLLPLRIAVVSSATAAGYGDFMAQLKNNISGFGFQASLFETIMQGTGSESSVITSLNRIYERMDEFDVVVIIRGGGSTADLHCFDSYSVAAHVAQFPLPILSGIGHERDQSVVDMVAHTQLKTPTAVAEFLIQCMDEQLGRINQNALQIYQLVNEKLSIERQQQQQWQNFLQKTVVERHKKAVQGLQNQTVTLQNTVHRKQMTATQKAEMYKRNIFLAITNQLTKAKNQLSQAEVIIEYSSPERLFQKGYSLTTYQGKSIRHIADLPLGAKIVTHTGEGEIVSTINDIKLKTK